MEILYSCFDEATETSAKFHDGMDWQEWADIYGLLPNHIGDGSDTHCEIDGVNLSFATHGLEYEYVQLTAQTDPDNVWTLIEVDGCEIIIQGFHHVNRLCYFITKEPFAAEFNDGQFNATYHLSKGNLSVEDQTALYEAFKSKTETIGDALEFGTETTYATRDIIIWIMGLHKYGLQWHWDDDPFKVEWNLKDIHGMKDEPSIYVKRMLREGQEAFFDIGGWDLYDEPNLFQTLLRSMSGLSLDDGLPIPEGQDLMN